MTRRLDIIIALAPPQKLLKLGSIETQKKASSINKPIHYPSALHRAVLYDIFHHVICNQGEIWLLHFNFSFWYLNTSNDGALGWDGENLCRAKCNSVFFYHFTFRDFFVMPLARIQFISEVFFLVAFLHFHSRQFAVWFTWFSILIVKSAGMH